MKISTLVGLTNTKLAGETLTYAQLRPLYDEVIVDINTALNACFPLFSVYTPDYNNLEAEYDCFPDTYLVSVVALGAAYKFYTIDEEGIGAAQTFGMEYQVALFHMTRDYSSSVPTMFQNTGSQGYISAANGGDWLYAGGDPLGVHGSVRYSGVELGINPDIRPTAGPAGPAGSAGKQGKPGNYYRIILDGTALCAVMYDSITGTPTGTDAVYLCDIAEEVDKVCGVKLPPLIGAELSDTKTQYSAALSKLNNLYLTVNTSADETASGRLVPSTDGYNLVLNIPKGKDGETPSLDGYALEAAVDNQIQQLKIELMSELNKVSDIAKGRSTGYTFDTEAEMRAWLADTNNTAQLVFGDNLYIRDVGVPDYWWDGSRVYPLETQKVDVSEFVKKTDYATAETAGLVKVSLEPSALTLTEDGGLGAMYAAYNEVLAKVGYAHKLVMAPSHNDLIVRSATHQDLADTYDPDELVTGPDWNTAEVAGRVQKDQLPISYRAVKTALNKLIPAVVVNDTGWCLLEHNKHYEITIPDIDGDEYVLLFTYASDTMPAIFECSAHINPSPGTPASMYASSTGISFFGDDCDENGNFNPRRNTHYEISFKRVGNNEDGSPLIIARVGAWQ